MALPLWVLGPVLVCGKLAGFNSGPDLRDRYKVFGC